MSKLFVITVRIQVDSRPPAKERQSTIDRAQAAVVLEFFASLLLRPAQNRAQQGQEFDAFGITPELCLRRRPDLCNILGNHYWTVSGYKDRLGMLCGKRLSCLGGARLKDDWGSLGARLTQMWTGDVEVFALVVDFPHTAGIGVDSALTIEDNSIVSPGRLPQFVGYSHIFLGNGISVVMLVLLEKASGLGMEPTCGCWAWPRFRAAESR